MTKVRRTREQVVGNGEYQVTGRIEKFTEEVPEYWDCRKKRGHKGTLGESEEGCS